MTSPLGLLLDDLASRDYRVSWSSTLNQPGVLIPGRRLLILAADRSEGSLVEVVREALETLPAPR